MTQAGSPNPRNDPVCIMSSCPRQLILLTYLFNVSHAAIISVGSLYLSPRTIMAQAIRAILLASATAATLIGRVAMRRASHGRFVPCCRAYRMTAIAPATSSQRKWRLPCFDIPPSFLCRRLNVALGPGRSTPLDCAPTRTPSNHPPQRLARSQPLGQRQGFPRAAGFPHTIGARHGYASRWLQSLCSDSGVLPSKNREAEPCQRWNAIIFLVRNNL